MNLIKTEKPEKGDFDKENIDDIRASEEDYLILGKSMSWFWLDWS